MHTSSTFILVLAVFGASLVEMVEALTMVVAAGVSRGWRSALEGAAAAALVLGVLVVGVGVPLIHYIPIDALRVVVGALLLVLGLGWLRKAILRSSGHKAMHDEDAIYAETVAELEARTGGGPAGATAADRATPTGATTASASPWPSRASSSKGPRWSSSWSAWARRSTAWVWPPSPRGRPPSLVTIVGFVVARQLSEVPENTIKTVVGIMLTSFGLFWVGEGAGVHWPGDDLAIPVLVGFFVVVYFAYTASCARCCPRPVAAKETAAP